VKAFLSISFFLLALVSQSQDLSAWRRHLVHEITQQSRRENNLRVRDTMDVIAVPVCFYACPGGEILQNAKTCRPAIDSFVAYGVLMNNNLVKGIAQNTGKKRYGFYSQLELQRLKRKEIEDTTWAMIKMARSRSSHFYFLYFFPWERYRYELIAFVEKGQTKYINRRLKVYNTTRQLINEHYPSRQHFITRMDEQQIKKILQRRLTFEEARKITAEDYIQYAQRNPQDTAGIMKHLLQELTDQFKLADTTAERLQKNIRERLTKVPLFRDKRYSLRVPLFDRNIFSIFRDFATPQQLNDYLEYRRIRNWLIQKAYEKLSREEEIQ
jgi:hypothetical protein